MILPAKLMIYRKNPGKIREKSQFETTTGGTVILEVLGIGFNNEWSL
jgi:hypothetical protein